MLEDLVRLELRRNHARHRRFSMRQIKARAAAQLQSLQSHFITFYDEYAKLAPTSRSSLRRHISTWVELAAFAAQPELVWLRHYMLHERRGRPAPRGVLWAILLTAAATKGSKDIQHLHENLSDAGALKKWSLRDLRGPKLAGIYDAILSLCGRRDPRAAWHANVAMLRRMSTLRDAKGALLHPELCVYGAADGTTMQGNIAQRPYKGAHHRQAVNGKKRARMAYLIYTNSLGHIVKKVTGYKLILIIDIKSTLPIIGGLYPASHDERKATLELVAELRTIWPDCPLRYMVGDALYDRSKTYAYELEFTHGIHPVSVEYPSFSRKSPHHETKGVPHCRHGEMKRLKTRFVYDTKWRARHRQPLSAPVADIVGEQGKQASDNAYIVWTCVNDKPGKKGCQSVQTRLKDDIRLYTYLPRSGSSDAAVLRHALLLRRGAVESINSSLKGLGVGRDAQQRVKWGGDIEMDWLTGLACCYLTGRRIAHETGDYQRAYEDAIDRGHIDPPSRGTASPAPSVSASHPGFYRPPARNRPDALDEEAWLQETKLGSLGVSSLLSWRHREQRILAEEHVLEDQPDDEQSEETRASEEAAKRAHEELMNIGEFELPLLHELDEWDADDEEPDFDDEDGAVQDLDENPEDAPLTPDGLDVDQYVRTHGDVDVSHFISQFKFDPHNPRDAIKLAKELDADEGLDEGPLVEAEGESPNGDEHDAVLDTVAD